MSFFETTVDDALGLWITAPQSETISFGVGDDSLPAAESFYRVNLPGDPGDSDRVFSSAENAYALLEAALNQVPARLDGLVQRTQENLHKQSSTLSFDVSIESQESGLEAELLTQLAGVERGTFESGINGQLNFGISETVNNVWNSSKKQFEDLLTQIDRDLLHFAWVETTVGGHLIARTTVSWNGDAQMLWNEGFSIEQLVLHQRNLRFVTQTRGLRFRLFVTITSGAVKVASLIATPGGAMLALPAVYQYVTKILAQARELLSIQTL